MFADIRRLSLFACKALMSLPRQSFPKSLSYFVKNTGMKKYIYYLAGLVFISSSLFFTGSSAKQKIAVNDLINNDGEGFVLMELFTSQGCSSCPSADAVLEMYAKKNDKRIIPLAFHVDYWNRLGWIDSLSKSDYSDRQREYGEKLNAETYTPQLVINGQTQLVGSNRSEIATIVNKFLNEKASFKINIDDIKLLNDNVEVSYNTEGNIAGMNINAALVQKNVFTQIKAGENRGVKLNNFNVVRDFKTDKLIKSTGSFNLKMPKGNSYDNYMVVLFVQDKKNGTVKDAVSKDCK